MTLRLTIALTLLLTLSFAPLRDDAPPNIVLIVTDDQGYGDLGFHGNPDIRTPVLDSLALRSTRFPEFYVSPVCAPTRASLMTGRWSLRTGVYDTYNGGAIMDPDEVTLAEVLRDAGYATGIFGKWHLGDTAPSRAMDQGFASSLVHLSGGVGQVGDVYNYYGGDRSYFDPILLRNGRPIRSSGYISDALTDAAIAFAEENRDGPFFLYLSFNAPHTPLQVPEADLEPYADLSFDPSGYAQPLPDMRDRDRDEARRVYAMVGNVDRNVGRLWQRLGTLGLADNTVIVFMTDNGPQQRRYNGGLRGLKSSVHEGGIRVPFFMHWAGRLAENHEVDIPAAHIDVAPTLLSLAGARFPEGVRIDGRNLLPAIHGEDVPWADRALFFHWQRGLPEPYRNVAVRRGRYKLVGHAAYDAEPRLFQLFDIASDPFERENIGRREPEVVVQLKDLFDEFYKDVMASPRLGTQRIALGTPHENPVILSRNDAKGTRGIWAQDRIYGYWDVSVAETALYDIRFKFRASLPGPGSLVLRVGRTQRTLRNADKVALLTMYDVPLAAGSHMFESWYAEAGGSIMPFWVEVARK